MVPDYEKAAAESIEGDSLVKLMEENRNKLNDICCQSTVVSQNLSCEKRLSRKRRKEVSRDLCIVNRLTGLILAPYPFHGTQFFACGKVPVNPVDFDSAPLHAGTRSSVVWRIDG